MSEFAEVERDEMAVQFVRVPDGLEHITRACVAAREGDELAPGLESGTLPGGRYLRARLRGEPPEIYEEIKPAFDELMRQAKADESRPSLEHYRRHDEIDLLLPI
jgi:DNA gyrase inhibitor GyrI